MDKGLVEPRTVPKTLDAFIESYIPGRTDITERRQQKLRTAKKRLVERFGDVHLARITAGDAVEYSRLLLDQLAPATAQKECQIASQFFRHTYRKELIERNPFEGVTVGRAANEKRRVFVGRDKIAKVLAACPNWQWRTVVALARFGGLRCSSEVALLKWSDIHWDEQRFTVTSPKTERYGMASRVVPIFPELRPFLDQAYFRDDADETWVVPMLGGSSDKNLGTTFRKIIARAGVEVWPKPFQNLRASRQTELEQTYPTFGVCKWLGNSPRVAQQHYLTVTDDHYRQAAENGGTGWGLAGDETARNHPNGAATKRGRSARNPGKSVFLGGCGPVRKRPSSGGGTRTTSRK